MKSLTRWWLIITQAVALLAVWAAWNMVSTYSLESYSVNRPGVSQFAIWCGFGVFALMVLGLAITAWRTHRQEEDGAAVILTALPLVVAIPILAFTMVRFFALR